MVDRDRRSQLVHLCSAMYMCRVEWINGLKTKEESEQGLKFFGDCVKEIRGNQINTETAEKEWVEIKRLVYSQLPGGIQSKIINFMKENEIDDVIDFIEGSEGVSIKYQ